MTVGKLPGRGSRMKRGVVAGCQWLCTTWGHMPVRRLAGRHRLRITDIRPALRKDILAGKRSPDQDYRDVDIPSRRAGLGGCRGVWARSSPCGGLFRQRPGAWLFRVNTLGMPSPRNGSGRPLLGDSSEVINTGPRCGRRTDVQNFSVLASRRMFRPIRVSGCTLLTKSLR